MRSSIILICALILIFDLADDGRLGKVKCVDSSHAAKCSVTSSHHASGKVENLEGLPPENEGDVPREFIVQSNTAGTIHYLSLDHFCFLGSSGGIPL